jgi:hypothetical protein
MLIIIGVIILFYSYLIFKGKYNIFPYELEVPKDYRKAAKSLMILGVFLIFLGFFSLYREIDFVALIMIVVILILILVKLIINIRNSN